RVLRSGFGKYAGPAGVARELLPSRADAGVDVAPRQGGGTVNLPDVPVPRRDHHAGLAEHPRRSGEGALFRFEGKVVGEGVGPLGVVEPRVAHVGQYTDLPAADLEQPVGPRNGVPAWVGGGVELVPVA